MKKHGIRNRPVQAHSHSVAESPPGAGQHQCASGPLLIATSPSQGRRQSPTNNLTVSTSPPGAAKNNDQTTAADPQTSPDSNSQPSPRRRTPVKHQQPQALDVASRAVRLTPGASFSSTIVSGQTLPYGYGGRQNPYDQRDNGYGAPPRQQGGYSQGSPYGGGRGYGQNSSLDDGYSGGNVEMAPLAQNASSMGGGDPNGILNECRDIDRGVDEVDRNLEQLRMLQQRTLDDADSSASSANNRQLDALSSETMALYRSLTERVRLIKSNPDSRTPKNNPQVSRVDRRLKAAIQQYQQIESQFRKRTQDQMARQYRIVRPNASEDEVRAAVEDTSGGQVFSQALMQSDRQGRARAALTAVQDRHTALVKIEQQMVELAQLFQDMDTLVVQQEAAVMQIEQKGEEVVDNLDKGNQEIGVAVDTARKTRKKKWICLGICVLIIIIVIIIVLVYIFVIRGTNNNNGGGDKNSSKRSLLEEMGAAMEPVVRTLPAIQPREAHMGAQSSSIDQEAAKEMSRIMRQRLHLPQIPQ
ncbi:hypothetical protein PCL_10264 [Purpureocillium lilacinum]|uniref:t-SNARE coiled-coil homology domain-containing protein n=1 Tax=Purpureocillium lilacinum TaxID=33203 RepID=A0A2U3EFF2_PURLI|nr:hypothetical protein PCL_10264 [Purpureocillium lilacinum]